MSDLERPRRCRNGEPHAAHLWRGLNTRGPGYYCVGRVAPYPIDPHAPVLDLMAALKKALQERGGARPP